MSILDINDNINNDDALIRGFIKDNYTINGTYTIKNGVFNRSKTAIVDVDGSVTVKNKNIKSLTNGLFRWGRVNGRFNCSYCDKIKSLIGAPEKCKDFYCNFCDNLKSLEGAPEKCNEFNCRGCNNLKSLEGAPKECSIFTCNYCKNLISLKGAPEKCNEFNCIGCNKL